jgi:hypothetical protein
MVIEINEQTLQALFNKDYENMVADNLIAMKDVGPKSGKGETLRVPVLIFVNKAEGDLIAKHLDSLAKRGIIAAVSKSLYQSFKRRDI